MSIAHMECCGIKEIDELRDLELSYKGATRFFLNLRDELTDEAHTTTSRYNYDFGRYEQVEVPECIRTPAFLIFSQANSQSDPDGNTYGDYFKGFIEAEGLGTVQETEPKLNKNSGNLVKAFLWTVNQEMFDVWKPKKAKKEAA